MAKVTFYCYANKTRSAAMRVYAELLKPEGYNVETDSAGVSERSIRMLGELSMTRASSWLIRLMESRGMPQIREHVPKAVTPELVASSDWNLTATRMVRDKLMEAYPCHRHTIFTLKEFLCYGRDENDYKLDIRDPCTPEGNSNEWYVHEKVLKDTPEAQELFLEEVERLMREFWSAYPIGMNP